MGAPRLVTVVALLLATATPAAIGQTPRPASSVSAAVDLDQLPKHPIPYRLLRGHIPAKPRAGAAAAKPAAPATPSVNGATSPSPPPATRAAPGTAATPPGAPAGATPIQAESRPPGSTSSSPPPPAPRPPPAALAAPKPAVPTPPPPPPPPALATPQPGARLKPEDPLPTADLEAFVDGQLVGAMAINHIHAMAVAVVQNGQLVLEKGYSGPEAAGGQGLDPRKTLVRLGSASQLLTWIAVLKAAEDGRLKLDDPVNSHLPDALRIPDEGFDRPVLLRHLISQSAGFEDRALGRRYVADPDRLLPLEDALRRYRPRRVRAAGLLSIPSDYGVALAGEAAAKSEGLGFDQMIEMKVLAPLGLFHTTFREPYAARDGLAEPLASGLASTMAQGFRWTSRGFQPLPFAFGQSLAPAVAASSTPDDMARLMIAMLNSGRLGAISLYNPSTSALIASPSQRPAGGMQGWGHGLAMKRLSTGHLALFDLGASLTFQSQVFLVPQLKLGVFVVADTDSGVAAVSDLPPLLVSRFYGGAVAAPGTPPPQVDVAGSYLSAQRTYHGLEAFADRLTLGSSVRFDEASGALTIHSRHMTKAYAPLGQDRFRAWDGDELLLSDIHDRAQAYILGSVGGGAQRVDLLHTTSFLASWAAVVLAASLASFTGPFTRDRTDNRETRSQTVANAVQIAACVFWCVAIGLFWLFIKDGIDASALMFNWPNRWLMVASWCALTASLLSLATVVQVPSVWRAGRRIQGWTVWRKIRHTLTAALFIGFAALLAAWGALEPWSS